MMACLTNQIVLMFCDRPQSRIAFCIISSLQHTDDERHRAMETATTTVHVMEMIIVVFKDNNTNAVLDTLSGIGLIW